jgi:hypothetical protein
MPELQAPFTGSISARRTLLCTGNILGPVNERNRLLLPGLRALCKAPYPRRILLCQTLDDFFFLMQDNNQTIPFFDTTDHVNRSLNDLAKRDPASDPDLNELENSGE